MDVRLLQSALRIHVRPTFSITCAIHGFRDRKRVSSAVAASSVHRAVTKREVIDKRNRASKQNRSNDYGQVWHTMAQYSQVSSSMAQ